MNNNAFTLLELIIVIIIIGVLSALALTRMFDTIEYTRSMEATSAMGVIARSYERCYAATLDYDDCYFNTPGPGSNNLDIDDPGIVTGAHFDYVLNHMGNPQKFKITATRNTYDGSNAGDFIRNTYMVDGTITRTGTGVYESIK